MKQQTPNNVNSKNSNKLASVLEQITHEAIKDLNRVKINDNDSQFQFKSWLKVFMFNAVCCCDAILAIIRHNPTLCSEAHALARLLLELFINIKYMYVIDPVNLSIRFYSYRRVWQYRFKESVSKLSPKHRKRYDSHADSNVLRKDYEDYMQNYGNNPQNRRYWSGKPLEQMADDVGERWLYNQVYRLQCSYTHPQSVSMISDLEIRNNDIVIKRDIDMEEIDRVLGTCISLFGQLYLICDDVFKFGKKSWIEDLAVRLTVLDDKHKIEQIIKEKRCPYCGELTIRKFDECKTIQSDEGNEFEEYYIFGCQNEYCVEKFFVLKPLHDDLQKNIQT